MPPQSDRSGVILAVGGTCESCGMPFTMGLDSEIRNGLTHSTVNNGIRFSTGWSSVQEDACRRRYHDNSSRQGVCHSFVLASQVNLVYIGSNTHHQNAENYSSTN